MSFAKVWSAQPNLLGAHLIAVEVDLSNGLHSFAIVGLPDKSVDESRDRVAAAVKNAGFKSPKQKNQKVVVSLAPAELKKEGPSFDLAIALSYLLASEEIEFDPSDKLFVGELSLDGLLRPIRGVLPIAREAQKQGFKEIFVPKENAEEAALIEGIDVYPVSDLREVLEHLDQKSKEKITRQPKTKMKLAAVEDGNDLSDVKGAESGKRGLEIAASGGHNIAMYGPPGTGKTMLARALASILPPLDFEEALEVTSIHSVAGLLRQPLITRAPFRAPHHTSSYVSLVGGGTTPKPGEVTLAHRGVLFMDEFPEFSRDVIEALRQPLEDREVSIARAKATAIFPANFILVAAMNPCPCGNFGSSKQCNCPPGMLARYQRKLSGPIIDRIDLWLNVEAVEHEKLSARTKGETSAAVAKRVAKARQHQRKRFAKAKISTNSAMRPRDLEKYVKLSDNVTKLLNSSAGKLGLSARSYHRVIKLARTIADLDDQENISEKHLLEALSYRPKKFV